MVQYYYDKFTSISTPVYSWQIVWGTEEFLDAESVGGYEDYTLDQNTGKVSTIGAFKSAIVNMNTVVYTNYNDNLIRYQGRYGVYTISKLPGTPTWYQSSTNYSKGSLVQSNIAAEDGTYPANGRHSDGYWYVKGAVVGPLPPGTVINQPYSTAGNGGRKLVRLSNGALVAAVKRSDGVGFNLYIKDNDNALWRQLYSTNSGTLTDVALAPGNNGVFTLYSHIGNTVSASFVGIDGQSKNFLNVDKSQTAVGNVSLAIDPTNGHLHAAWTSKNSTYPNSFNIRYAKSIDGGVTWSAVEQVSKLNYIDSHYTNPSIVIRNGNPVIIYQSQGANVYAIQAYIKDVSGWISNSVYLGNTYVQSSPSAVVDKDGVIHVAWSGTDSNSSVPKIRYSKSTDGGISWATQTPILNGYNPSITTDKNGQLFILFDTSASIGKLWLQSNNVWLNTYIKSNSDTNVSPSALYDVKFDSVFGDIPPLIHQVTGKSVQYLGSLTTNSAPTIALTSPSNNQTLYENDTLNISGNAYDSDKDQSVTVFYQINSEQRKVLATNLSQTQIALSKQLTFRGGKLYDGDTALTGTLADGVAHTLKVWAEDSEKASSANVERTFYVVPNRAPLLSVDAVVPSGVVDADKFKISGTASDQDANSTVKVTRRINAGNAVEIYSGAGGAWEFELALSQLVVGQNTIVIEVVDNYGAKTSKTITLNKNELKTPILQSVTRYKITPPSGSAKGVLLFIERDEALNLKVELSMTLSGEQEQYETLTASNTAPMPNTNNIVEDTYYHEKTEPKDNIILKLSTTRPDATVNHKIHLISGAVE